MRGNHVKSYIEITVYLCTAICFAVRPDADAHCNFFAGFPNTDAHC